MRLVRQIGIDLHGADQLVCERVDHDELSGPQIVGVDLIAAEHELMRTLQRIFVEFGIGDEIVDHRHRIGMFVRRPAA